MLKDKTILIGVTGSIAAYKIADLVSALVKQQARVQVIMTRNATNFINPLTFETLTGTKCLVDTFDRNFEFEVAHIALAKRADLALVAPATANIIGKLAGGIADDMLTTTLLAVRCPLLLAPAMNTRMYQNPVVQDNLNKLKALGYQIIEPGTGHLACGDVGTGKLPSPADLLEQLRRAAWPVKDLAGKKLLITAGPTREALDPVRFLSNHSTGKMGYALARQASYRGGDVTLISGPTALQPPSGVRYVPVTTAAEMFTAVKSVCAEMNIIIKAAAVADYTPAQTAAEKIKKQGPDLPLALVRTVDILQYLGAHKTAGQFLCGFSMETEHLLENSRTKLENKNLDMIAANNLKTAGAGFGTETNVITLIMRDGQKELPLMSKDDAAGMILDTIIEKISDC